MVVEGLGLYVTMQCQAACGHCGVWSGPDRKEHMALPQARSYIEQLAALGSAKVVVFVGGEPLIHLEQVCELITLTRSFGITAQVSTNAFWASSEDRAKRTMEKLVAAGLNHLALSADTYHTEFIDPRNVGRAFAAARGMGVVRKLQVISSQVNSETDQLFASTGIDPAEVIDHSIFKMNRYNPNFDATRSIVLCRHAVAPFGRGAFLRGHAAMESLAALEDVPCFMAMRFPIVYPNGDLYTCCCTAGFYKEYRVGNLEQEPLSELNRRMNENVVFEAISKVGPVALAKAVCKQGTKIGDGFSNPCHACRETLSRTDKAVLESESQKLLLMHALLEPPTEHSFHQLV
jgi:radical SAM protein with 4Fe4S-binding SPASM domain